ncbi:putative amino-acid import ATP-binding protein YxeO [Pseudooceanicola marinus]|uniref:Putative amino-acid import ATP-binding protein YxeO n=1 Tax=Pseudooceanicola marinus TaxID=396013 RepID=A0A1X6ZT81_9RHOB|nr:ABC transporter ATP-binding protein [Pseudooceanicola marinus]MBY5972575.1 ABC transporter ATP-binding protein [Ferrimonas balearica]MCA1335720.1 ABC transporter ATP-binding protein [Pseudooceanicola marinus]PJE30639.1 ABC transporter ATP-binding protein [Pseudooceanicola marinus]SLN60799.1 putative amino-acid import ATP-binding protein YxeO [Pseudooceanicola marinus]
MTLALELKDLRKSFGPAKIIQGVNLQIEKGERHAIIGPNGAGKSTLFNLISGRFFPSSGEVKLNGEVISGKRPFEINRMGLSRSFQVSNIFTNMTVRENVRCGVLYSMGYGMSFWRNIGNLKEVSQKTAQILDEVGLLDKANLPAASLPYADQRTLEIAITIAGGAEVILLDEPTAGMSHSETDRAVALIEKASQGKTLLIVEHDMGVVFGMADRISVLVYGEIIATGTPEEIRGDAKVREAYLGEDAQALEGVA